MDNDYNLVNTQLCERIKRDDKAAETLLILHNNGLIHKFVNSVKERHMLNHMFTYDDAIQEASLALLKAASRFEYKNGASFSTYAWWFMFASMEKSFDRAIAHIPVDKEKDYRLDRMKNSYIKSTIEGLTNCCSFEDLFYIDYPEDMPDEVLIEDIIVESETFNIVELRQLRMLLEETMSKLTDKEQKVIKLRYGWNTDGEIMTFDAIGKEFGVQRERIRQIVAKALRKMRLKDCSKYLKDFLYN